MADNTDDFEYIPDDIESMNDRQIKKVGEDNKENNNKILKKNSKVKIRNDNEIVTDEENYNFDTIKNNINQKNSLNSEYNNEELEDIKFDDISDSDRKNKKLIPKARIDEFSNDSKYVNVKEVENLLNPSTIFNLEKNKIKDLNQQKNIQHLRNSTQDIINEKQKLYIGIHREIDEQYENLNLINRNKLSNDNIDLSNISHTRTPKYKKELNNLYISKDRGTSAKNINFDDPFNNISGINHSKISNNKTIFEKNKPNNLTSDNKNTSILDRYISSPINYSYANKYENKDNEGKNNINYGNISYISYKMPSLIDMNSKINKLGTFNPYSKMQYAETKYAELKSYYLNIQKNFSERKYAELQDNTSVNKEKVLDSVSKYNFELLKYIENLNKIINVVIDASKVPIKNPNYIVNRTKKYQNNNSNINEINNNKLLEVFKKEFIKLDQRFKQISEPSYEEKLEESLAELEDQIYFYENENKKLKISQKQSEAMFERQYKNNNLNVHAKNFEINKVNIDYENTRKLNENVLEKIQKNKIIIADNEQKIKELIEWLNKLETIAKEMYGITDFLDKDDLKRIEKDEKEKNILEIALKKKTEVLEKVLVSNKKKFELDIVKNEKTIVNLEKQKIELIKFIKEKSDQAKKAQLKVKELYSQYNNVESYNYNLENKEELNSENQLINKEEHTEIQQLKVLKLSQNDEKFYTDNIIDDQYLENEMHDQKNFTQNLVDNNSIYHIKKTEINSKSNQSMNNRIKSQNLLLNGSIENTSKKDDVIINLSTQDVINKEQKKEAEIKDSRYNLRLNKPNFKFNINFNQLNEKKIDIDSTSYLKENEIAGLTGETNNNMSNFEIRKDVSKPFRVDNCFIASTNSDHKLINDVTSKNIREENNDGSTIYHNKILSTSKNQSNDVFFNQEIKENKEPIFISNSISRRKNANQNYKNELYEEKNPIVNINHNYLKDNNLKEPLQFNNSLNKIAKIETANHESSQINLNGNLPSFLDNPISIEINNQTNLEINNHNSKLNHPHNNKLEEKIFIYNNDNDNLVNKREKKSSTNLFSIENIREKMVIKEKKHLLENIFSDEIDDIREMGNDNKKYYDNTINNNLINEKKKIDFDNLFKDEAIVEISNQKFMSQMNKNIPVLNEKRAQEKISEDMNYIIKSEITKKKEKSKNLIDELEDIVL